MRVNACAQSVGQHQYCLLGCPEEHDTGPAFFLCLPLLLPFTLPAVSKHITQDDCSRSTLHWQALLSMFHFCLFGLKWLCLLVRCAHTERKEGKARSIALHLPFPFLSCKITMQGTQTILVRVRPKNNFLLHLIMKLSCTTVRNSARSSLVSS